ncbi:hypothetical protein EZJ19_03170 [Parasulfuritortus cantonensis]|uniref:Beta-barrel porin 2 n=1 Tax=Parasulfuritortus cantonensis TaxID=2528202 RepID=A0A4R1BKH3_9PROT|nr:XrtB/PEP-CTERM-associated polysaccharide biosynthesis outer membrane protein EpsL [Parasulfuritortus cantonensis]TCJ17925.1 hypothetical protein EZJ19_03170 [Parasulfuritortus cantonensis]
MSEFIGRMAGRLSVLSAMLVSAGVWADDADVFNLYADAGYTYDSNLFRVDDGAALPWGKKSDNVLTADVGVSIDKPFSQQRFRLDASVGRNRYSNHSFLDYDSFQYSGRLDWHVSPRISGVASSDRTEALVGFDAKNDFNRTVRTRTNNRFEADFHVVSRWHALAGYLQEKQSDSYNDVSQDRDFDLKGWSAGLRYDPGSGRKLEFRYISRNGRYRSTVGNFDQTEYEARLVYPVDDKTRIEAVAAYVDRNHDDDPQRDYDGWRARATLTWAATGKLGVRAEYERQLRSWQDVYSSYYTADNLSVGPYWSITAKQTLAASLVYGRDQYGGAPSSWAGPSRDDKRNALVLTWSWEPTRTTGVTATARRQNRDSNYPGFDYTDTMVGVGVHVAF